MTWVIMRAMTTTNGTPSNQRMIGMTASLVFDPHGINQIDNSSSGSWFLGSKTASAFAETNGK
jgi:hypothetical protein